MLRCNVITSNIEIPGEFKKKLYTTLIEIVLFGFFFMRPLPYHDNENTCSTDTLKKKATNF